MGRIFIFPMAIRKTGFHSFSNGSLPKGCKLCVKGQKTVVFITGICTKSCMYCPISEQKSKKDVIYINEWPTRSMKDLVTEIRMCSSKGAGITGGDPLARLDRTVSYIKHMKRVFGKNFHIHLYTPLVLVSEKAMARLYSAGLDEIRFHPDLWQAEEWHKLAFAKRFSWDVGIEIPAVPGMEKETRRLIDVAKDKIDFLNINELEISDTNASHLSEMGFRTKDRLSYGVKGSEELAKRLLRYADSLGIPAHYCTSRLKDRVQLAARLKRRARNARQPFDFVTDEGMLVRAQLLYSMKPARAMAALRNIGIRKMGVDKVRSRLLFSVEDAYRLKACIRKAGFTVSVVEEYPTWDSLNVQTIPL
jgi:uncharacterized protein